MTIKEATQTMLKAIRVEKLRESNYEQKVTDRDIAVELGINYVSFSRLITGVTKPKIITWFKITKLFQKYCGLEEFEHILDLVEE